MIDPQLKALANLLAMHRAQFAPFGPWSIDNAFMFLDMNRFRSANDPIGNFDPKTRA